MNWLVMNESLMQLKVFIFQTQSCIIFIINVTTSGGRFFNATVYFRGSVQNVMMYFIDGLITNL
jgi:hypothetical protein